MTAVKFPAMRSELVSAIEMIAYARDSSYWAAEPYYTRYFPGLCIHILYDDEEVFPDPEERVGTVILESEVEPLRALYRAFDPLVEAYDAEDGPGQTNDPRWQRVETLAHEVLKIMKQNNNI